MSNSIVFASTSQQFIWNIIGMFGVYRIVWPKMSDKFFADIRLCDSCALTLDGGGGGDDDRGTNTN